ncbi:hypothetical protein CDV55_103893 [Aspergillus turcosus]|nr:hypothetical protein CDV55_103893 [Aspergillus turcosus]
MEITPTMDEGLSTIPPTDVWGQSGLSRVGRRLDCVSAVLADRVLFSCGDCHAMQGHDEVCGTAIETCMNAALRFAVLKDLLSVTAPQYMNSPTVFHARSMRSWELLPTLWRRRPRSSAISCSAWLRRTG